MMVIECMEYPPTIVFVVGTEEIAILKRPGGFIVPNKGAVIGINTKQYKVLHVGSYIDVRHNKPAMYDECNQRVPINIVEIED